MKKSFMTRVLAMGLSVAMAFSMSTATNLLTASAATTPAFKSASFKVQVGGEAKTYTVTKATAKSFKITKAVSNNTSKATVAVKSNKKGITVTPGTTNGKTKIKVTFKNNKTKKTTTKSIAVSTAKAATTTEKLAITKAEATKANELTVTFASAVATSGAAVTVTKDSATVETSKVAWSADAKSVVITTTANMAKGTYTITVKSGEETATGTAEVVAQYVKQIKILNETALTGKAGSIDAAEAYIYYDVLDQYGVSLRNSTTIDWNTSCGTPSKNDKTVGKLTVKRSDDKAFTYGEQIFVSGVYAKTGVSVNATVKVGAAQALNTISVKGFVKKNTSTLLTSLPAGFKSDAYYVVYAANDQNGNAMGTATYITNSEVTFVSDNVLIIKEVSKTNETTVSIDGVEYNAAFVQPGQNVNNGGTVKLTAIANKTGNKTELSVAVGDSQILKSFTMSAPAGVLADGETATIPFKALDQNGKEITSFTTLASQTDFNNLTLNASEGTFSLQEANDGTAVLKWSDTASASAWNSNSEDGIDRPVSLTAVVVGGETSNEMIYVTDKAMPVAIKSVDVDAVYLEGAEDEISLSSFTFLDQYGRTITNHTMADCNTGNTNKGYICDNGFFAYQNNSHMSGTEFSGYNYGVKVEFSGSGSVLNAERTSSTIKHANTGAALTVEEYLSTTHAEQHLLPAHATAIAVNMNAAGKATSADQTLKFSIERTKNASYDDVSPVKTQTFKAVDIHQVKSFTVGDLKTFYVNTNKSGDANGVTGDTKLTDTTILESATIAGGIAPAYQQKVVVTGIYNGTSVTVPANYYQVSGTKIGASATEDNEAITTTTGAITINSIDKNQLSWKDLYDVNSAKFTRKDATDVLTATIGSWADSAAFGDKASVTGDFKVDTTTKSVNISDAAPYASKILADDAYTFNPTLTALAKLDYNALSAADQSAYVTKYGASGYLVEDQYGVKVPATMKYKASDITENADRYTLHNFTVTANDTATASVKGAELGDKFKLTISANYGGVTITKALTVTVGADDDANITGSTNNYKKTLVGDASNGLEVQRQATLGNN